MSEIGRGDWIRTSDLFVPNEARYQTAPRPGESNAAEYAGYPRPPQAAGGAPRTAPVRASRASRRRAAIAAA